MKNYREYVRKGPYCKGLFLVLLVTIGYEMFTGHVLTFMRPITNLGFILLGVRILSDSKLEKTAQAKKILGVLIIGYGIYFIWNTISMFS